MDLFYYIFTFIFGLCIGSFLNVVILRLKSGQRIVNDRSYCPKCKKQLKWYDNVPVLSFIFLKGKCRYCQKKISWQYILVELATGVLFLISTFFYTSIVLIVYYWIIISFLVIIFVYDLKYYLILDKIVWPAIGVIFLFRGCLFLLENNFSYLALINYYALLVFSAIIISGFFLGQFLISKGKWIGGGDIRLGFLMGLILGWPNCLWGLLLSYILGSVVAVPLLIFGWKTMSSKIPFGVFLTSATLITLFFGEQIVRWYLNLFYV